ncbi:MAG: hypothetical protein HQP61_02160 [Peptococcaceae bacterium]|nr:hypothetical protein [Candidatus Syntrophopropionicum ammoniitolerans]
MSEDSVKYGRDELLAVEESVLQDVGGVFEAMDTMEEYELFKVVRGGKELFSFRVRGLDDQEGEKCRTEATKMVKSKRLGGVAIPTDLNAAKYNSMLIVAATHPEDRPHLWNNKELQEKAKVITGWQVVDKVLKAGEKERVIELIEKLSGYDEEDLDETLKNS